MNSITRIAITFQQIRVKRSKTIFFTMPATGCSATIATMATMATIATIGISDRTANESIDRTRTKVGRYNKNLTSNSCTEYQGQPPKGCFRKTI